VVRALGLVSGGLDSVLAVRMLQEQDIEVVGICFETPFFDASKALVAARVLDIELRAIDFTDEHLVMLKAPVSGYGRYMNPCIDCHALMLKKAGEILEHEGFDFIFTGEVLGERPMSQNRNSLRRVANLSGFRSLILRPLSAQLLDETQMERDGLVDRSRLGAISGRSRKPQLELVDQYGIKSYEAPAGGCLLTDPAYSRRLRSLFERMPKASGHHIRLLRKGRLFWVGKQAMVIVGRNKSDNDRIRASALPGDLLVQVADRVPGALVLVTGHYDTDDVSRAAGLAVRYSDASGEGTQRVSIDSQQDDSSRIVEVLRPRDELIDEWRVSV